MLLVIYNLHNLKQLSSNLGPGIYMNPDLANLTDLSYERFLESNTVLLSSVLLPHGYIPGGFSLTEPQIKRTERVQRWV